MCWGGCLRRASSSVTCRSARPRTSSAPVLRLISPNGPASSRRVISSRTDFFGACRNRPLANVFVPARHDGRPYGTRSNPMQYLLMIYNNEAGMAAAPAEGVQKMNAAYMAYTEAMNKAGVVRGGNRLRPTAEATTVRVKDGKNQVLDGPYADTKEQLAGFFLIDVPDLDAAISWASKCPGASTGTMEVRPIWQSSA